MRKLAKSNTQSQQAGLVPAAFGPSNTAQLTKFQSIHLLQVMQRPLGKTDVNMRRCNPDQMFDDPEFAGREKKILKAKDEFGIGQQVIGLLADCKLSIRSGTAQTLESRFVDVLKIQVSIQVDERLRLQATTMPFHEGRRVLLQNDRFRLRGHGIQHATIVGSWQVWWPHFTMYDLAYIFDQCGFDRLPDYIDRSRLFNVSFDVDTGEIKLYVLDESERFAYKISKQGISKQYSADDPEHGADLALFSRRLGCRFDETEIVVDAVERDMYYVYLDDSGIDQRRLFIKAVCNTYALEHRDIVDALNAMLWTDFEALEQVVSGHVISLVRIPLDKGDVKIYARPFHRGMNIRLDRFGSHAVAFLCRLLNCDEAELPKRLKYMWVARNLRSGQQQIVTQYHELLHKD